MCKDLICKATNGHLFAPLLLAMMLLAAGNALAQQRSFPPDVQTGTLAMGVFPDARIDGTATRFGAGARILDLSNRLVLPASLTSAVRIAYRTDHQGLISQAWVISEAESAALSRR